MASAVNYQAFQRNAFQNDAFQVWGPPGDPAPGRVLKNEVRRILTLKRELPSLAVRSDSAVGQLAAPAPPAPTPALPPLGVGDILSGAIAYWGLFTYSRARAGSRCFRLRRDSDNTLQDFNTFPGSGLLDTTSIISWAAGANVFTRTIYDQVAGFDVTQANGFIYEPELLLTGGPAGNPTISISNIQGLFTFLPNWPAFPPPHFISAVALCTATTGSHPVWADSDGTGGSNLHFNGTNINLDCNFNNFEVPSSINTWYAIQALNTGALNGRTLRVNGVVTTGGAAAPGAWVTDSAGVGADLSGYGLAGKLQEVGVWNLEPTPAQMAAIEANQRSRWRF